MDTPLQLGEAAPYFEGHSTQGFVKLTDYSGKWLVFFSHPADFTPVCTSEFVSFAKHSAEFRALNCNLLGLSPDSIQSHAVWVESIRKEFGVTINFPIIEDTELDIARRYRMTPADTGEDTTVRALFIIDPHGVLRGMLYYPCSTGRSVAEVLRLVQALQVADQQRVLTPEGWQPGQATLEPPKTVVVSESRKELSYGCVDWYDYRRPATRHSAASTASLVRRAPVEHFATPVQAGRMTEAASRDAAINTSRH